MVIDRYIPIVGNEVVDEIKLLSKYISGKVIQHINSTAVGGGVAEILNRLVPLFEDLGIKIYWDVIRGDSTFFGITKKIHNALHGKNLILTHRDIEYYNAITQQNIKKMRFNGDVIVVHDPQPLGLIKAKTKCMEFSCKRNCKIRPCYFFCPSIFKAPSNRAGFNSTVNRPFK